MKDLGPATCEITCPTCRRVAARVVADADGSYTVEDYRRGIGPWDPDRPGWGKQVTQWQWRPTHATDPAATWAAGAAHRLGALHAARGVTCTKCKRTGTVRQSDLIARLAAGVPRLQFDAM